MRTFNHNFLMVEDSLAVTLHLPNAPFTTNGTWDKSAQQLHWKKSIPQANSDLPQFPTLLFAFWSEPNETVQTKHFGQILLQGEDLSKYALWFRGLSANEAKEWRTFLDTLRPTKGLSDKLKNFRFSQKPQAIAENEGAPLAVELLLKGLENDSP